MHDRDADRLQSLKGDANIHFVAEDVFNPNYSSTWEIGQRKYMWRQDEPHVDRIPRPSYS